MKRKIIIFGKVIMIDITINDKPKMDGLNVLFGPDYKKDKPEMEGIKALFSD